MTETLTARDGTRLHLETLGDAGARRTLVIVHGYGEHGGRYLERAKTFADAGFRVLVPDVRGHGRSGGPRGHVMAFEQYLDDLDAVVARSTSDELYLFGHSHGGLITATWLLRRSRPVEAAALSSPFFGLAHKPPRWKTVAGRALSRVLPKFSMPSEIDPAVVSHDPAVVAAYATDPLNHKVANSRWFTEAQTAQAQALRDAPGLSIPTLVMQAGDDRLVTEAASRAWARAAPASMVRYECIDGAFHELLFEPNGQEHADRILRWFEERV
jgi:alpha-beta hydrolase superfamily lysophospholipase